MGRLTQAIDFVRIVPLPEEIERSVRYAHLSDENIMPIRREYKLELRAKKKRNDPKDRLSQIKKDTRLLQELGIKQKQDCSVCKEVMFENRVLDYVMVAYPDDVYLQSLL